MADLTKSNRVWSLVSLGHTCRW